MRGLQVATTDGRVKVFGREGVERMFPSPAQCPSRQLRFLDGTGTLLRVTQVVQQPVPYPLQTLCH